MGVYVRPPDKHSELLYHRVCAEVKHIFVKMSSFFRAFGLCFFMPPLQPVTNDIHRRGDPCGRPRGIFFKFRKTYGESAHCTNSPYVLKIIVLFRRRGSPCLPCKGRWHPASHASRMSEGLTPQSRRLRGTRRDSSPFRGAISAHRCKRHMHHHVHGGRDEGLGLGDVVGG